MSKDGASKLWYYGVVDLSESVRIEDVLPAMYKWVASGAGHKTERELYHRLSRCSGEEIHAEGDVTVKRSITSQGEKLPCLRIDYSHPYSNTNFTFRNVVKAEVRSGSRYRISLQVTLEGNDKRPVRRRIGPLITSLLGIKSGVHDTRMFSGKHELDGRLRRVVSPGPLNELIGDSNRCVSLMLLHRDFSSCIAGSTRSRSSGGGRRARDFAKRLRGAALVFQLCTVADKWRVPRGGAMVWPPLSGSPTIWGPERFDPVAFASPRDPRARIRGETDRKRFENLIFRYMPGVGGSPDGSKPVAVAKAQPPVKECLNEIFNIFERSGVVGTSAAVVRMCQKLFPDSLLFAREVSREADLPVDPADLWRVLWILGRDLLSWRRPRKDIEGEFQRRTGRELAMGESNETTKDRRLMEKRKFTVEGIQYEMVSHIKMGRHRLYFDIDRKRHVVVVGHIGGHLPTSKYR
jgi:hypothetical protein